jgi:hypothetical protein
MVYLYDACDQISDFCHQQLLRKMWRKISWTDGRMDRRKTVYPPSPFGQRGYKKCDGKWAYMFNVYKNQQSRQTGSRNLMGPKMLPTIWGPYMKLVTKYQISAINSYWEKCAEKYLGRTEEWKDGRTDRGKTVYPPSPSGSWGIKIWQGLTNKWELNPITVLCTRLKIMYKVWNVYTDDAGMLLLMKGSWLLEKWSHHVCRRVLFLIFLDLKVRVRSRLLIVSSILYLKFIWIDEMNSGYNGRESKQSNVDTNLQ